MILRLSKPLEFTIMGLRKNRNETYNRYSEKLEGCTILCVIGCASCSTLEKQGRRPPLLIKVDLSEVDCMIRMLQHGRVDLIIGIPEMIIGQLRPSGIALNEIETVRSFPGPAVYLVAHKSVSPDLLERLTRIDQTGLPKAF